jgi:hypothetical protein
MRSADPALLVHAMNFEIGRDCCSEPEDLNAALRTPLRIAPPMFPGFCQSVDPGLPLGIECHLPHPMNASVFSAAMVKGVVFAYT